jgi:hypothetical protein
MSTSPDPQVLSAHRRAHKLFQSGDTPVADACRAVRDIYAALPYLDAEDRTTQDSYRVLTSDLRTLLAYMTEAKVPTCEPGTFRDLVMRVIYNLSRDDQPEQGLRLSKAVYREWSQRFGERHVDVIYLVERQAACHLELDDAVAATGLMKKVLARRGSVLGDDDPRTLRAAANLGTSLNSVEDFHSALRHNQETVRRCHAILGPDHDTTLDAASILARSLVGLGELETALSIYRDVWARRTATSGADALATLHEATSVAVTLTQLGEHEEAVAMHERLCRQYEHAVGASHPLTVTARRRLAHSRESFGRDR